MLNTPMLGQPQCAMLCLAWDCNLSFKKGHTLVLQEGTLFL